MGEGGAERGIRILKARGLTELGQVASGYAEEGIRLGNRKV